MKIDWLTKQGVGANFKVGDRIRNMNWNGTIVAIDKDFQKNIDTGCPYYNVKIKFDNYPHISYLLTNNLKLNSKTE